VSGLTSVASKDLVGPSKEHAIVKAQVLVCYWSVTEIGMLMTDLGKKLSIAVSTVSGAEKKRRQIAESEE
jgi:hypothetical protein